MDGAEKVLENSNNLITTVMKIILIICCISFIIGFFLPWLQYIPRSESESEELLPGVDIEVTEIFPLMIFIASALIFILVLYLFNIRIFKNNFIIIFFSGLALSILMLAHINRFSSRLIGVHRTIEITFSLGIWICTISAIAITCLAFIASWLDKQYTNFRYWPIQKMLFVIILLLFFATALPYVGLNISLALVLLILIITLVEWKEFRLRYILVWNFVLYLGGVIFYLNIRAPQTEPKIWFFLTIVLIIILIWSHAAKINMFKLKYELTPEILKQKSEEPKAAIIVQKTEDIAIEPKERPPKPKQITTKTKSKEEKIIDQYMELFQIDTERAKNLFNAGYSSLKEFKDAIPEDLLIVDGINPTLAKKIIRISELVNV